MSALSPENGAFRSSFDDHANVFDTIIKFGYKTVVSQLH